ncbi:TIGR04211 family SH3 domain-containing protein [Pseudohaliea sp.]|uniref:TIGR04211 family SH3 domain-containing protein n=1 Tax=Pseudohaliea sp. TaxID=2740289 RepID=UPI0032EAA8A7
MNALARLLYAIACAACLAGAGSAAAQDSAWVGDEVFIVLHAGPGTNYRWVAKLNPGTALEPKGTAEDGAWTEVTTDRGTEGWVRSEFLTRQPPAQVRLPAAEARAGRLQARVKELEDNLAAVRAAEADTSGSLAETEARLAATSEELANIKQVSGRALALDEENRQLNETVETLRSELDVLKADNQRLQDKLQSSAFLDGALAVLLGVIITLVVPRLWPRRRSSSSWA